MPKDGKKNEETSHAEVGFVLGLEYHPLRFFMDFHFWCMAICDFIPKELKDNCV